MSYLLEEGIAERLQYAEPDDVQLLTAPHILQVLSVKAIVNGGRDLHRVILSDGVYYIQALLAIPLTYMVSENILTKNTIIVTQKLSCNFVQGKRLLILLGLSVQGQCKEKIGDPTTIMKNGKRRTKPASATTTPAVVRAEGSTTGQQQHYRVAQGRSNSRPVDPIQTLNPYQNNWTIKARVTRKSDMKARSNQYGVGKSFYVTLMDESGEIRGTAFNAVADDLYGRLDEGKAYYISKAEVILASDKVSDVSSDYELWLERNTEIEECLDTSNLPMVK